MIKSFFRKFRSSRMSSKVAGVILVAVVVFAGYLGVMQARESKRLSEYKDTKINQVIYINNKKFEPSKPYKIRNEIVFLPLDDVLKALGDKYSYTEESFGKIVLKYQGTIYDLKKGSNIVYNRSAKEEIKMDGRVELMQGKLYVPLEFIKDCMYVNILELSGNRVFIDSFKERFKYDWMKDNKYIAHAMGGIDKKVYTNSLDAFEFNYKLGYRVFEFDLALTSDNQPVLLHSWGEQGLKDLGLSPTWTVNKPTLKEFLNNKINGMYTPLSFRDVCKLAEKYKDVQFVVDVKGQPRECKNVYEKCVKIAKEENVKVLDRMIPQIYDEQMLNDVMDTYEFKSMIYTLYKQESLKAKEVIDFSYENGIKAVVIDKEKLDSKFIKELKQRGIYVYVNTYNDTTKVKELFGMGAKGIYSDFINPKNGENRYEFKEDNKDEVNN